MRKRGSRMFDFSDILELLKTEPGHNFLSSFILLGIWLESRKLRKQLSEDKKQNEVEHEDFKVRLTIIEREKGA